MQSLGKEVKSLRFANDERVRRFDFLVCNIVLVLLLSGCAVMETKELEIIISKNEVSRLDENGLIFELETKQTELIDGIFGILLEATKPPEYFVLRDPYPNAYVLADGTILLTTGLLATLSHPEQLAFIIAHELAHWHKGHTQKRIKLDSRRVLFKEALDITLKATVKAFWIESLTKLAISGASGHILNHYSQESELEADSYAADWLERVGFSRVSAIEVFTILENFGVSFDVSQYPKMEERIQNLGQIQNIDVREDERFIESFKELRSYNAQLAVKIGDFDYPLRVLNEIEDNSELTHKCIPEE